MRCCAGLQSTRSSTDPTQENVLHHAGYTAPTRQHELDHTNHTDHTDQEYVCPAW